MNIKLNDVYRFRYNDEWIKSHHDPYWCFDGQLIVKQDQHGELYFVDTYWGFGSYGDGKSLTLDQALQRGELTFVCNLDEIEPCSRYDLNYYADDDLYDLSYQNNCYKAFYKRKGAVKSAEKMRRVIQENISDAEYQVEWHTNKIERLNKKLDKLDKGDMDFYI